MRGYVMHPPVNALVPILLRINLSFIIDWKPPNCFIRFNYDDLFFDLQHTNAMLC